MRVSPVAVLNAGKSEGRDKPVHRKRSAVIRCPAGETLATRAVLDLAPGAPGALGAQAFARWWKGQSVGSLATAVARSAPVNKIAGTSRGP